MNKFHSKVLILVFMWSAVAVYATAATALQDTIVQICRSFAPPKPKDSVEKDENHIYEWVQEKPSFPGREEARLKWLSDNVVYPADAAKANIEGVVAVSFIVEEDGSIADVKVIKGVHPLLDQEAVRVTESMPKWEPGKMRGKVTRSYMMQPIMFVLK